MMRDKFITGWAAFKGSDLHYVTFYSGGGATEHLLTRGNKGKVTSVHTDLCPAPSIDDDRFEKFVINKRVEKALGGVIVETQEELFYV